MPASVSECICQHGRKHHAEQCWSKHAALFDTVGYGKEVCWFATIKDTGSHALEELADDGDELVAAAELGHDVPEPFSADRVKGLGQVHESGVEIAVLLHALLLRLAKYTTVKVKTCLGYLSLHFGKTITLMILTKKFSPHVSGQDVLGVVLSEVGRVQHVLPGEIQQEDRTLQDKHFHEVEVVQGRLQQGEDKLLRLVQDRTPQEGGHSQAEKQVKYNHWVKHEINYYDATNDMQNNLKSIIMTYLFIWLIESTST